MKMRRPNAMEDGRNPVELDIDLDIDLALAGEKAELTGGRLTVELSTDFVGKLTPFERDVLAHWTRHFPDHSYEERIRSWCEAVLSNQLRLQCEALAVNALEFGLVELHRAAQNNSCLENWSRRTYADAIALDNGYPSLSKQFSEHAQDLFDNPEFGKLYRRVKRAFEDLKQYRKPGVEMTEFPEVWLESYGRKKLSEPLEEDPFSVSERIESS
jgi:hypothetical protein